MPWGSAAFPALLQPKGQQSRSWQHSPPSAPVCGCPRLPLAGFPAHGCQRGGGIRVGDLCLAQCSASLCERRAEPGRGKLGTLPLRAAPGVLPDSQELQLAPSQRRGCEVIPKGKTASQTWFLLKGKPEGLGESACWRSARAAWCKVRAWGKTQLELCIHQRPQMLAVLQRGGTRRGTRCVSTPGSHQEDGSGFVPCYTESGSIWHVRPWGRRGAAMALQRGSALAGSPGREGWRRSRTQPVNPSCVVVAAMLGTKHCLPGSSPAQ